MGVLRLRFVLVCNYTGSFSLAVLSGGDPSLLLKLELVLENRTGC